MTAYVALPASARPDALRLFCFHHAGGTATSFAPWTRALADRVSVLPVQLPGRERRAAEPRFTSMTDLVTSLDRELEPMLDEPYAFYGHSMGAIVAYALARHRRDTGRSLPRRLVVGASAPPSSAPAVSALLRLSGDELADWLIRIGGMSPVLRGYPEWVRAALDVLRDDLRVSSSLEVGGAAPLPCPIDVFTGADDPLLGVTDVEGWAGFTTAGCTVNVRPGGHFFIHDHPDAFLDDLARVLTRL